LNFKSNVHASPTTEKVPALCEFDRANSRELFRAALRRRDNDVVFIYPPNVIFTHYPIKFACWQNTYQKVYEDLARLPSSFCVTYDEIEFKHLKKSTFEITKGDLTAVAKLVPFENIPYVYFENIPCV